jgi:steroid delta-isomerase-like uncharacterized protein
MHRQPCFAISGGQTMSTEQNKTIVRRIIEDAWGRGNAALLEQLVAKDVCDHNPMPGQPRGLEGQRWMLESIRRAVPNTTMQIHQLVAQGDLVVDHWTTSGTQTGELFSMPATGRRFTMTGSDMMRLSNGKVTEMWHHEDMLTMMQQLGMLPQQQTQGGTPDAGRRPAARATGESGRRRTLSDDDTRKLILRGYQEFIDRANPSAADTLLTPDYEGHFSATPPVHGREAFKQFIAMYNSAFSNHRATVEDIVIEGDYAACRATFTGKHTGSLMGVPPSGKQVTVHSLSLFRFAGDQLAEQWANNDDFGMLQQMGAMPVTEGMPVAEPC